MPASYQAFPPERLLSSLEEAGRYPDPDLIRACRARRQEITAGLLDMLAAGIDEAWAEDDPRWYREIHAGLLLIEFREPAALPLFEEILRDEDRAAELGEWFDSQLPAYGPSIIPMLAALATDPGAPQRGRVAAVDVLGRVGQLYPETRGRIVPALRNLLPPLGADGALVLAEPPEDVPYDDVELWTWAVAALAALRDEGSRPQVVSLFMEDLIDEVVVGDVNAYLEMLAEEDAPALLPPPPDLEAYYEDVAMLDNLDDDELLALYRDALLQAGVSDEEADEVIWNLEARLADEHEDAELLLEGYLADAMRQLLAETGLAGDRLDQTVAGLLVHMLGAEGPLPEDDDGDLEGPPAPSGLA